MIIKVKVKPNSEKQEIIDNGKEYIVHVKSEPEKNKANIELINLLSKYFNRDLSKIKIKSGAKTNYKLIELR